MLEKHCPHCGKNSYSSSEYTEPWICPTCGEDITDAPVKAAMANDPVKGSVNG